MKICYLLDRLPCPPVDGTPIRLFQLSKALRRLGEVTVVFAPMGNYSQEHLEQTRAEFPNLQVLDSVPWPSNRWQGHWWGGVGGTISDAEQARVTQLVEETDLVWVARLTVAHRVRLRTRTPSVLDMDDLNYQIHAHELELRHSLASQIRCRTAVLRWKRRELEAPLRFHGVAVCSQNDRKILGNRDNVRVIPNGFEAGVSQSPDRLNRIGFIGTLAWWPNRQGVEWFLRECWPEIHRRLPDLTFRVVGRGDHLAEFDQPGVERLGYVEDAAEEWASWSGLVVPLLAGGGTRIKILEAFSRQCPVVSTSIGAYGIEAVPEKDLLLADSARAMVDTVIRLVQDKNLQERMSASALAVFQQKYDWNIIGEQVGDWCRSLTSVPMQRTAPLAPISGRGGTVFRPAGI